MDNRGSTWILSKKNAIQNPDGSVRITRKPKVTGKGQVYFVNKFISEVAV